MAPSAVKSSSVQENAASEREGNEELSAMLSQATAAAQNATVDAPGVKRPIDPATGHDNQRHRNGAEANQP